MKKSTRIRLAGVFCALGMLTALGVGGMTASATTVGDVIAHARALGMPESQIQHYINQFNTREYTSEECDKGIASLDEWAAKRDQAIEDTLTGGTTTAVADAGAQTTTTAATVAGGAVVTTAAPTKQEFINMSLDEKVNYVNSLPAEQRTEYINNMSNEERNSFLKQLDPTKQAEVVASMMDLGDTFGLTFSVDSISDGALAISARDENGNLVDVTTFGNTVEQTGVPYTLPIAVGGGAILLAAAGLGAVVLRSTHHKEK